MSEENGNDENNGEDEPAVALELGPPPEGGGPISGAFPTALDIFEMVGGCECGGIELHELCCPPKKLEGPSKDGSEPPPGDDAPTGYCKLLETNISMGLGPHIGFALEFEGILKVPPVPPAPPFPPPLPALGIPSLDVPGIAIPPLAPLPEIPMPGMDLGVDFLLPNPELPGIPFPALPFIGIVLFPISFALGLFTLSLSIPIPTADPCTLVTAFGLICVPDMPGLPMLNIAICFLCLLLFLLMILMPLLVILVGLGVASIDQESKKMLDANGEEVKIPPPLIIGNPQDNRSLVETFQKEDADGNQIDVVDPGVSVNEFNKNTRVKIIAKKFDLKKAFNNSTRFSVGPNSNPDVYAGDPRVGMGEVRAGTTEGDEQEDGAPGPEEQNMEYEWRIYAPEELDETDVIAFIGSLGFTTEDEKDENGQVVPGGVAAGTFRPKTLDERTPIFTQTKTHRQHGASARQIDYTFPKIGSYEVICFARKTQGSLPVLQEERLQVIVNIGEEDSDGVWRSNKRPTEFPEVLKDMKMPAGFEKIKRTKFPLEDEPPYSKSTVEKVSPEVKPPKPKPEPVKKKEKPPEPPPLKIDIIGI